MSINCLTKNDKDIVYQCLVASLEGAFFPEWEFYTLFGVERNTLAKIVKSWPNVDDGEEEVFLAINNTLGNLVGYPHGRPEEWKKYISATPEEVTTILQRWKNNPTGGISKKNENP